MRNYWNLFIWIVIAFRWEALPCRRFRIVASTLWSLYVVLLVLLLLSLMCYISCCCCIISLFLSMLYYIFIAPLLSTAAVLCHKKAAKERGVWHCLSTANCKLKLGELLTVKTVPIVLLSLSSLMLSFYCCLARFQIIATGNIDNMFVFTACKCVERGREGGVSKLVSPFGCSF